MNFGPLNRRREFLQNAGVQRQRVLKYHRLTRLFEWKIRDRDFWKASFLGSKAGPESRVDDRSDRLGIRLRRQLVFAEPARFLEVASEVFFHEWSYDARCLVRWTSHISICP